MTWYTKQELCIRWGAEVSPYFAILVEYGKEEYYLHRFFCYLHKSSLLIIEYELYRMSH